MEKTEIQIGENIYTCELGRDIKQGEPFIYRGMAIQVLVAENKINVHDNSTHLAIVGMKKV